MTKKKGKYHPSQANETIPAEQRVEQLRKQGESIEKISNILKAEKYNQAEIMGALKVRIQDIDSAWKGGSEKQSDNGNGTLTVYTDTTGASQKPPAQPQPKGRDYSYEPITEEAKTLARLLSSTAGVNPILMGGILEDLDANPEFYKQDQSELMDALERAGLSRPRAASVVKGWIKKFIDEDEENEVITKKKKQIETAEDALDQAVTRTLKLQQLKALQVDPIDSYLEDAMKMRKMRLLDQEIGVDSPSRYASGEEIIEMEPLLDAEGKEVKNKDGAVQYITRKIKRAPNAIHSGTSSNDDQMLERMMKLMQFKVMADIMGNRNQMPASPYIAVSTKPIIGEDGKPVMDQFGNQVMEITQTPIPMQNQGTNNGANDTIVKILSDMVTAERSNSQSAITELASTVNKQNDSQLGYLQTRLDAMENTDPTDGIIAMVDKLKTLGVLGAEKTDNIELKKLDIDLQRWKHDNSTQLQKWIWEQKQMMADKQYARGQLKELGSSIRHGIEKLGVPLVKGVAEGLQQGVRNTNGGGRKSAPQQQQQTQQSAGANDDLTHATNDELIQASKEADDAERVVTKAKRNIAEEMDRRGVKV